MIPITQRFRGISRRTSGFILVTTLILVAFLVVLLVTLAMLLRVETQASATSQKNAMARQNALLGLDRALAELQVSLGPDQRVSAPAALSSTIAANAGAEMRLPYVTGVWKHSPPEEGTLPQKAYSPELVTWLVSGNENRAPSDPDFVTPQKMFSLADPSTDPSVVWLVGNNSVEVPATIDSTNPDPRIKVRTVPLKSKIGTTEKVRGSYAWWVGDEGTKARMNLVDPFAPGQPLASNENRIKVAQTMRVDAISGLSALAPLANQAAQGRISSAGQLFGDTALFGGLGVNLGTESVRKELQRKHFHSLTASSLGLLTDTRDGGLRRDLTRLLSLSELEMQVALRDEAFNDVTATPKIVTGAGATNQLVLSGVSVPNWIPEFPKTGAETAIGPTWEQLRSFYNLPAELSRGTGEDGGDMITARTQTKNRMGVGPVLIQAKLFFGIRREEIAPDQYEIYVHYYPMFVIGNPHTVDLAPGDYFATFAFQPTGAAFVDAPISPGGNIGNINRFNTTLFKLSAQNPIPAGGASVFCLDYANASNNWDADSESYEYNSTATYQMVDDFHEKVSLRQRVPLPGQPNVAGIFSNGVSSAATVSLRNSPSMGAILWNAAPSDFDSVFHTFGAETSASNGGALSDPIGSLAGIVKLGGGFQQRWTDTADGSSTPGVNDDNLANSIFGEMNMRAAIQKATLGAVSYSGNSSSRTQALINGRILRFKTWSFYYGVNGRLTVGSDFRSVPWLINYQNASSPLIYRNLLFHVPRSALTSLGELQHFNTSGFLNADNGGFQGTFPNAVTMPVKNSISFPFTSFAYQPPYVIGNSMASKYLLRETLIYTLSNKGTQTDASYLLNSVLWDRFYFSSVDYTGGVVDFSDPSKVRSNKRYVPIADNTTTASPPKLHSASASLGTIGAFNVNSTSVAAWKALISGLLGADFFGESASSLTAFPRSEGLTGGSANAGTGVSVNAWTGFRSLTDAEIERLAQDIVTEVKRRGPFVSLSDFVNRRLVPKTADPNLLGVRGALAAALHSAGINRVSAPRFANKPTQRDVSDVDPQHTRQYLINDYPGWVTQADLLQKLAPYLTARSDTFTVRAYGEVKNPATGAREARAWCEAVVQRTVDFVDDSQPADTARPALNAVNQKQGRRFEVVSFRWLTPEEI